MSTAASAIEKAHFRNLPQPFSTVLAALTLLGVAAFLWGLTSDPQKAWLAFHSNFIFLGTLAQGGAILAAIFVIVGAQWPGPMRRMAEGLAAWVPVTLVLSIVGYFGGDYLFEWQREGAMHGKEPWLNATRFYVTDIGVLAVLTAFTLVFLKRSARPTLGGTEEKASEGFARNMVKSWTSGWTNDRDEKETAFAKLSTMSPLFIIIFALGYSVIAFDQVMSMEQSWFSNLFGAFVSWGGILSAVAAISLCSCLSKSDPVIGKHITEDRMHDIGKLLFAFSIFWMYLFWAQYLVIWYGNLPEETLFFFDRLGPQFMIEKGYSEASWAGAWSGWDFKWSRLQEGYGWVSMVVWACLWLIPFFVLLGQRPKKTTWILGPVAGIVLLGFYLERMLLTWPSVIKNEILSPFGAMPILIGVGMVSAFTLVFLIYTRVFPGLALEEEGSGH